MFFLDSLGFFSLVSLLIQCGLAWIFLAFFAALAPRDGVWMRRLRLAFVGLGLALSAVSLRFAYAHVHVAAAETVREGDPAARIAYSVYLAGKVAFVWFLVGAVAALRQVRWPERAWIPAVAIALAAAVGFASPTVESVLLAKSPVMAVGFFYAWHCLRRRDGEEPEIGRRAARGACAAWGVAWIVYGITVLFVGPFHPDTASGWNLVLRVNSLVDLTLQSWLAVALIVVVMRDAQRTALVAMQERDRLRDRVQRDERLRTLSTLVGGVAHELGNPLTAILGFADDLASADPAARASAARIVREQAERCRNILKRMSLLGQRPELSIGPVDVGALLERVAKGFQPQLAQAGVAIDLTVDEAPCELHADPIGLEQIMTNLIANALQASPRGARIAVSTVVAPDALHLIVDDQGPGVPIADRPRIFEPFWTSKKAGEGTGLGLAVARVLAQAHGGQIVVGDAPGGGARFDLVLPWTAEHAPAPDDGARSRRGLNLLVVDDEPLVRATIARQAERYGWAVEPAMSGEQALDLLLDPSRSFDAVVCDLRMSGLSGIGLHDELVKRAPWLLRRLLFVTGDLSSADAAEFAARCNAPILTKPFGVSDLFRRLRDVVGGV